jgi:hypothetical protein
MKRPKGKMRKRPAPKRRFPAPVLALLRESRMLGVRAGTDDHRFTGIWFVLLGDRLVVRPRNDDAAGWHRVFLEKKRGTISVSGREIRVRAKPVRSEAVYDAMDAAYAEKYDTKGSQQWVRGFRLARRRKTTTELLPA